MMERDHVDCSGSALYRADCILTLAVGSHISTVLQLSVCLTASCGGGGGGGAGAADHAGAGGDGGGDVSGEGGAGHHRLYTLGAPPLSRLLLAVALGRGVNDKTNLGGKMVRD